MSSLENDSSLYKHMVNAYNELYKQSPRVCFSKCYQLAEESSYQDVCFALCEINCFDLEYDIKLPAVISWWLEPLLSLAATLDFRKALRREFIKNILQETCERKRPVEICSEHK